jgi:hypothetical protein
MLTIGTLTFWFVLGLLGVAAWQLLGKRFFSPELREERRRRRNYKRVTSRRHRPTVSLAVKVPRS